MMRFIESIQMQDILILLCIILIACFTVYRFKVNDHNNCRDRIIEFWETYIGPSARRGRLRNPRPLDELQLKISINCLKKRNVYDSSIDENIRHDLRHYEQTA